MGHQCFGIYDPIGNPNSWGYLPGQDYLSPGFLQEDDHPVVCVSWEDAMAYASWLSAKTGQDYRLPTEAEWEYAARAGSQDAYSFGDDESLLCQYGNGADRGMNANWTANRWCADGVRLGSAPVGSYHPNAFGLRDTHGNVHEWVADCYHDSYAEMPASTKTGAAAWIEAGCKARVIRGGCWAYPADGLRSARRESWGQDIRSYCVGFRVAKSLPP
jgi:formylglycine-generating enzyme required for sulfatase activity